MSNNGKRTKFLRELKNLVTPNLLPRSAKRNLDGKPRFDDAKHIGTACNLNAKFDNQLDNYGARDDGDRIVVDNNIDDRAGNTVEKENIAENDCNEYGYNCDKEDADHQEPGSRHIILYLPHLLNFICNNFVCRRCQRRVSSDDLKHLLVGVAGAVNWTCAGCSHVDQISPLKKATSNGEDLSINYSTNKMQYQRMSNFARYNSPASDYSLNWRFNLLLQQIGGGILEANSICSMLDLRPSVYQSFRDLEQKIGMVQVNYGKFIIHNNLLQEMSASPLVDVTAFFTSTEPSNKPRLRHSLSIQLDTGWSNRGSGRSYNSDSGHSVMFGNKTKKIVSCYPMSKRCAKCEQNIPHSKECCSKNYDGSSKGMEAYAGSFHTRNIWSQYGAFIGECVMDDDSSTRSVMRHNHRRRVELGLIKSMPLTAGGNATVDHGKLPDDHPPIRELCDHNHRCRGYCKELFKLGRGKQQISKLTVSDAERIKANFGYWLRQNLPKPFDEFKRTSICIIDHHFNCHDSCDRQWCKFLQCKTEEERKELSKTYRDKSIHTKMYQQVRDNHDTFMTEEALRQLHHPYHTNNCEGFMWNVASLCPKTKHYCRTINYEARCFLAVGTNSLGYEQYYDRLFQLLDLESGYIITDSLDRKDRAVKRKREYRTQPEVRKRIAKKRIEKIIKSRAEVAKSNARGHCYESGISGPSGELGKETSTNDTTTTKKLSSKQRLCPLCGLKGHTTARSKKCLKHIPVT